MQGYGLPHDFDKWEKVEKAFSFAKLGVIINAATNWIFFCGTCSVFRKEIRKFLGLKLMKNQRLKQNISSSTLTIQSCNTVSESSFWNLINMMQNEKKRKKKELQWTLYNSSFRVFVFFASYPPLNSKYNKKNSWNWSWQISRHELKEGNINILHKIC